MSPEMQIAFTRGKNPSNPIKLEKAPMSFSNFNTFMKFRVHLPGGNVNSFWAWFSPVYEFLNFKFCSILDWT